MQFRCGTVQSGCAAGKPRNGRADTGGEYYGSYADGKHHAVWYVFLAVESGGDCCYRCRHGSANADAVHSDDHGTLDTGRAHCTDSEHACAGQHLQVYVYVGRGSCY